MSLSKNDLHSIQNAGHAVYEASAAIAAAMQVQAETMVTSIARQPFGDDSEQALVRFKSLARLNQGLTTIEAQLRELYVVATELGNPAPNVLIALPSVSTRKKANLAVVDVVAKSAKTPKAAKVKAKKAGRKAAAPGTLTANDSKLLQYLQSVLKTNEMTAHTGSTMASGAGLPLGSVGISLKKILATGAVNAGERGMYQLGVASGTPDVKPVVNAVPAKGVKSKAVKKTTLAKKTKAKALKKIKTTDTTPVAPESTAKPAA